MRDIVEYQDYRSYMRDFFEERKRTSDFSWRAFSRLAGFASPSYLRLVCEGKTRLSMVGVSKVVEAMGLTGFRVIYFETLVRLCDEADETKKLKLQEKLREIIKENQVRVVDSDALEYYEKWWNPVIRELAPQMPHAKPLDIAKRFYPEISAADVRNSMNFLVHAGFLKKVEEGVYKQTEKGVVGSSKAFPMAIRGMHYQMGKLAVDAIKELPSTERFANGITMGVSRKTYERITQEMEDFRKKLLSIIADDENCEQVYRMNLQLFPITK